MSKITTASLLREMTDLENLARYPDPYYTTLQFSSYDRRSVAPDAPGWFANGDNANTTDRLHYLRDEIVGGRTEHVLGELEGPGALVRFWSANPWFREPETLRIYVDDNPEPVIASPMETYVNGEGGIPHPFTSRAAGGAGNVYFPIPFAKKCKVTHDANWRGFYFQVNFRQYAPGTEIESFQPSDLETYADVIEEVGKALANPTERVIETLDAYPIDVTVEPDGRGDVLTLEGPAAIGLLTLRVSAPDTRAALRQTVLQIFFDGSPTPQIESPIGDFFGAGPGVCPYVSTPFVVEADGTMHCRWVMPFREIARVRIHNYGSQTVTVTGQLGRVAHGWDDRSMHLRAKWRVDHGVEGRPDGYDWPYLIAHGSGVWVGTALMIMHPTPIPTPGGGWWGEGDEKIYVDGEPFPSTFGTGSEDYFGYSWSSPDLFNVPYIGMPRCDGPGNRGYTANFRWHIADAIPFAKSLEFYMELQTHVPTKGVSYGRIGYCYTRPGTRDDHPQLNPSFVALIDPPAWSVVAAGAAGGSTILEAESIAISAGRADIEHGTLWSGGKQISWNAREGETLSFSLPVTEAAKYRLVLCLTARPGGGSCKAAFAGVSSETVYQLTHPSLTMLREFYPHEEHELGVGSVQLRLTCVHAGQIGLDYVRLAPVK